MPTVGYVVSISYGRGKWEFASVPGENTLIYFGVMYCMYAAQIVLTIVSAAVVVRRRNQVILDMDKLSDLLERTR